MNSNQLPEGLKEKIKAEEQACPVNPTGYICYMNGFGDGLDRGAHLALEWMAEQQPVEYRYEMAPMTTQPLCSGWYCIIWLTMDGEDRWDSAFWSSDHRKWVNSPYLFRAVSWLRPYTSPIPSN